MQSQDNVTKEQLNNERRELLVRVEQWFEMPMIVLGFVWLALLIVELRWGLTPTLEFLSTGIWIIFIIDFLVRLIVTPDKRAYLKQNWLTIIALIVPAFRILRVFRALRLLRVARTARGLRLLRVITSLNRGMRALSASMGRKGFGYVLALTGVVNIAGATGMYAFESGAPGSFPNFGAALWWTAMLLISMGTDYWPKTAEGRVLALLIAVYGLAVFGYVTAALASFFIGRDAQHADSELVSARPLQELQEEVASLREEIMRVSRMEKP
jgi:voltage-gated potassium channel